MDEVHRGTPEPGRLSHHPQSVGKSLTRPAGCGGSGCRRLVYCRPRHVRTEPPHINPRGQPLPLPGAATPPYRRGALAEHCPLPARCVPREHPPPQLSSAGAERPRDPGDRWEAECGTLGSVLPSAGMGRVRAGSPAQRRPGDSGGTSLLRCMASEWWEVLARPATPRSAGVPGSGGLPDRGVAGGGGGGGGREEHSQRAQSYS